MSLQITHTIIAVPGLGGMPAVLAVLGVPAVLRNPEKMHALGVFKFVWLLGVPAALRLVPKLII